MHPRATAPPLAVHIHAYGAGKLRIVLVGMLIGETTRAASESVRREWRNHSPESIELDLTQIRRIDASGVECIASLMRAAGSHGARMHLTGASAALRRDIVERNAALALQSRPGAPDTGARRPGLPASSAPGGGPGATGTPRHP